MSVTLICQLAGSFPCWHTATWKTERCLWRIKRDRWVRHERRSNTIMFFRYEYKTTQLTGHTRFYFISQCTRPPYFVFFVLFSSDYLHLILTARRHLEHFRFKTRVSILDLSLKCKTPAITNIAWVNTYPLRYTQTHILYCTYTGSSCSSAIPKSNVDTSFLMTGWISTSPYKIMNFYMYYIALLGYIKELIYNTRWFDPSKVNSWTGASLSNFATNLHQLKCDLGINLLKYITTSCNCKTGTTPEWH